jgi:predicted glutamine amidotransferase
MCIAILNTKKAGRLPKSQIKNSWDNNEMGSGLLWSKDNKLNVFKSYDYDDYIDKYNELRDDASIGNIVLHFRIATSGYNGEHNLHPFLVSDDLGFVHNGVISGLGNKDFSDTYEFNDMLKKFKHNFLGCNMTKYFVAEYIGYSKLIFLDNNDKYNIINEQLGKWTDGNWYSNDSYKKVNDYSWYGNEKVSKTAVKTTTKTNKLGKSCSTYVADDLINYDDEWIMYDYICDIYGLDPEDERSWDDIAYYMALNNAETITDMYKMLSEYSVPF